MKIQRVTLDGSVTGVRFEESRCGKWLVKNFGDEDIFVSFDESVDESESVKIASGCGQVIVENERLGFLSPFEHDTIYILGTGEVEVQQLWFH
ncbi:MAG: hypothetical protein MJ000_11655 [Bacteroidales bacterium]|nr:hypothetical protein [Bacteroidales bacterium]